MRWYRTKFILTLIGLILVEEVTPFVPFFGLVVVIGCCYPRFFLGIGRALLRYYDATHHTALAGRIPTHAAVRAVAASLGDGAVTPR